MAEQAWPRVRLREKQTSWADEVSYKAAWRGLAKWAGVGALALTYVPIVWLAVMSFSFNPLSGRPFPLSLHNYVGLFGDSGWHKPLLVSVVLSTFVAVVTTVIAVMVGRALPRLKRPGRVILLAVIPLFVPGMTLGSGLFVWLRGVLGLQLGYWSVFAGQLVWSMPFSLLVMLVVTIRFDRILLEAAEDLGAGPWRRFWDIEFPLIRAGVVGAWLFSFLLSFNELQRSIFLRGLTTTMPVYNWEMAASQQSQVPILFALSTLIFAVTLPIIGYFFWMLFSRLAAEK